MTWFLRKSIRIGPLRLNLSKRGLGASVGVKGARIGVDAEGRPYAAGGRYGLYFRERLGARRSRQGAPAAIGGSGQAQPPQGQLPTGQITEDARPPGRGGWVVVVLLALLLGLLLGVLLARAGESTRVDLFDQQGRRTGYAVVDQGTGRVDFYDARSNHTGWGRVDATGRTERFDLTGTRQAPTVLPVVPQPKKGGR